MRTLRSRVGVSAVEGKLFAFGGYDGASRLCTVECYDPKVRAVQQIVSIICVYISKNMYST